MGILEKAAALIEQNKKIQAIKILREHTGASLKDAKSFVDHYQLNGGWPRSELLQRFEGPSVDTGAVQNSDLENRVRDLWSENMRITAIKVWREETGMSLKESKEMVDQICADIPSDDEEGFYPEEPASEIDPSSEATRGPVNQVPPEDVSTESVNTSPQETVTLPPEHPIWSFLNEEGQENPPTITTEGVLNLEEGVIVVNTDRVRFYSQRFEGWKERASVSLSEISSVSGREQMGKFRMEVRHRSGTLRFQGLNPEAFAAIKTAVAPLGTVKTSSGESREIVIPNIGRPEKIARLEHWLTQQYMPNSTMQLKKLVRFLPPDQITSMAETVLKKIETRDQVEVDFKEALNVPHLTQINWLVVLDRQTYVDLLADRWEPPEPPALAAKKGGVAGCVVLLVAISIIAFGALFIFSRI